MSDSSDDEAPTLLDVDENLPPNDDNNNKHLNNLPPQETNLPSSVVPVTILTGFLGSGKTTLLKNILTSNQHNRRIAVIENEFGGGEQSDLMKGLTQDMSTLSIETMIAKDGTDGSSLSDLIELPNGCICCTVKDSLVSTLENLIEKRSDLDYIIIECSGMADPGPVASVFWLDDALGSRLRLDGIVGVVDVMNILGQLEETSSLNGDGTQVDGHGDEAARQIAVADRIICNKVDLVGGETNNAEDNPAVQNILDTIKVINPTAPTILTAYATVDDITWVLNTQCFDPERAKEIETSYEQLILSRQFCGLCTDDSNGPVTVSTIHKHRHTSAISTIALFQIGSVDLHRLNSWLASILWPDQDEKDSVLRARLEQITDHTDIKIIAPKSTNDRQIIYRIKGVISVSHSSMSGSWIDREHAEFIDTETQLDKRRYIVQAVNDLWDVTPAGDELHWKEGETRCCKIVVIGKRLDEDLLRRNFEECF